MTEQSNTSSETSVEPDRGERPAKRVVVRYGQMKHLGVFRHSLDAPLAPGTKLVVRTERGTELAAAVINIAEDDSPWSLDDESLKQYLAASGPDYPFSLTGRVLRPANAQDINDQQHLDRSAEDEAAFCREQIKQLELDMKLVAVEHLLGGDRIVFFFAAEHRVDFRELVKRLAEQYHTRIEMRQIGARDEARLVADYERCGRRCCCQEYLKILRPVSMRMAKTQKATLDPTKISGRCGRLMCCLRYEDATYEELRGRLPKKNTWVRTADGVVGKVLDTQILTQLVRLMPTDRSQLAVPNEEIVEHDVPAPPEPAPAQPARPAGPKKPPVRLEDSRGAEPPSPADEPFRGSQDEPSSAEVLPGEAPAEKDVRPSSAEGERKRRGKSRRRRGKKGGHPGALSAAPQVQSQPSKPSPGQRNKKKRRRKPGTRD